jgi:hypothetical protein
MRHILAIIAAVFALAFTIPAYAGGHGHGGGFGGGFGAGGCVAPSAGFSTFGGGYGSGFGAAAVPCGGGFSAAVPTTVVTRSYAMPIVQQQVVAPVAAMSYGVAPAFGVGGFGVAPYGVSSFGVAAPYAVGGASFGVTGAVVATPRVGFFARRRAGRQAARQVRRSLGGF